MSRQGMGLERVLIYRLGSLGDTIAALPCFHLIERAYPDAERVVLTNFPVASNAAPLEAILLESGLVHRAIPYPVGTRDPRVVSTLARTLRRESFTEMVYLAAARGLGATRRDLLFFRAAGIRRVVGAPTTLDLQRNRIAPTGELERESSRLLRTVSGLGQVELADRRWWDLRLTESERGTAQMAVAPLGDAPFVAVNTGGKAVEKDWGEPNWHELLSSLAIRLPGYGVAFVGAGVDSDRAERLRHAWTAGPTLDLCGSLTPRESAAALALASGFIGHDSGPLHLADAVGTPAVGIFGNYNRPAMWHPSGATTRIIHEMRGLESIPTQLVMDAYLCVANGD